MTFSGLTGTITEWESKVLSNEKFMPPGPSNKSISLKLSCINSSKNKIRSLKDSNGIRTHDHLFRKRALNHLVKLGCFTKWLSVPLWTK